MAQLIQHLPKNLWVQVVLMVQEILNLLCFLVVLVVQVGLMVQKVPDYQPVPDYQLGLRVRMVQAVLQGQKIQMDPKVQVGQIDR
jgi:hypothetical protein